MDPTFGITFPERDDEPRAVIPSDMSTICYVGTAPDADEESYPLNTPILLRSSNATLRAALGDTGTLPDAVKGAADQLQDFQSAVEMIIIRVEEGENDFETIANIIGEEEEFSGMWAALLAGPDLAKIPRLFGFPGYTHQRPGGLVKGAITPGSGGTNGTFPLTFTGGTAINGDVATGTYTVSGGALTAYNITHQGNYSAPPTATFTGSANLTGAAVVLTLDSYANPICSACVPLLNRLLAHAVVEGPGTNEAAIKDWREDLISRRLIPIDLWCKVQEGVNIVTRPGAPRVLGLIASVDYQHGGAPMHSAANRPIAGIVGFVRNPGFSLTDGATEGQSLLSQNIGIGVRGELGVESAAANSGFIFIGTDNAGDDPLWQFYNVTRGRDYIHLGLLRTLRIFLGRNNIEGHVIQAVLNTTQLWLMDLQADRHILGSRVSFDADKNSPEQLRFGKFSYFFQAEEPPPLRQLEVGSGRYRPALEMLIEDILASTQTPALAA